MIRASGLGTAVCFHTKASNWFSPGKGVLGSRGWIQNWNGIVRDHCHTLGQCDGGSSCQHLFTDRAAPHCPLSSSTLSSQSPAPQPTPACRDRSCRDSPGREKCPGWFESPSWPRTQSRCTRQQMSPGRKESCITSVLNNRIRWRPEQPETFFEQNDKIVHWRQSQSADQTDTSSARQSPFYQTKNWNCINVRGICTSDAI